MGNRYLAVAAAAAATFLFMATPGAAQEKLMVGSECTYFPFNYRDSDNVLKGYDIDVANEIGGEGRSHRRGGHLERVRHATSPCCARSIARRPPGTG